jgi:hypothetical protein
MKGSPCTKLSTTLRRYMRFNLDTIMISKRWVDSNMLLKLYSGGCVCTLFSNFFIFLFESALCNFVKMCFTRKACSENVENSSRNV